MWCITTSIMAFKKNHYSRVQAILEYTLKSKNLNRPELLIEKRPDVKLENFDIPKDLSTFFLENFPLCSKISCDCLFKVVTKNLPLFLKELWFLKKKYLFSLSSMIQGGLIGVFLKKLNKIKYLIYDDMDYYPLFYSGLMRSIVENLESTILKSADTIFVVSRTLMNLRMKRGIKNLFWLPNGVDNNLFKGAWVRKKSSSISKDKVTLIYSGSLNPKIWGAFLLLSVAKKLKKHKKTRVILLGSSEYKRDIYAYAKKLGIKDNVLLLGGIPHNNLPKYFAQADVGMALGVPGSPAQYADPIKIKEYMSAGLPVVGTDIGDIKIILKESNSGLAVKYDVDEVANAVMYIVQSPNLYRELSFNARQYATKYFDWKFILNNLFKTIHQQLQEFEFT